MTGYMELAKLGVFSPVYVKELTGNKKTGYSLLNRLMKKGMVKKIRQNMYSCVNPTTNQVVASRYQIACAVIGCIDTLLGVYLGTLLIDSHLAHSVRVGEETIV